MQYSPQECFQQFWSSNSWPTKCDMGAAILDLMHLSCIKWFPPRPETKHTPHSNNHLKLLTFLELHWPCLF